MIQILIADDQDLVRRGLSLILAAPADIEVLGEAGDGGEAIEMTRQLQPDVVLMDVRMPRLNGIEATRVITAESRSRVMMLTTFDLDEYVYEALRAGASGFLLKDSSPDDLVHAVRVVAGGDALLSPSLVRRMIDEYVARPAPTNGQPPQLASLTERELDTLRAVARGLSNAEIARELHLSPATVKTHVAHVLTKLDARDRVQAVITAYESGLIRPGSTGQTP